MWDDEWGGGGGEGGSGAGGTRSAVHVHISAYKSAIVITLYVVQSAY